MSRLPEIPVSNSNPAPNNFMRRNANRGQSLVNAMWSDDVRSSALSQSKKAKSDSQLVKPTPNNNGLRADVGDLLSVLHTEGFCGRLDPKSFDHSLKYDEWIRLPSGRKSQNSKRVIIPTPMELYDMDYSGSDGKAGLISCDSTVSSGCSNDSSSRKRSREEIVINGLQKRGLTAASKSATVERDLSSLILNKRMPSPR